MVKELNKALKNYAKLNKFMTFNEALLYLVYKQNDSSSMIFNFGGRPSNKSYIVDSINGAVNFKFFDTCFSILYNKLEYPYPPSDEFYKNNNIQTKFWHNEDESYNLSKHNIIIEEEADINEFIEKFNNYINKIGRETLSLTNSWQKMLISIEGLEFDSMKHKYNDVFDIKIPLILHVNESDKIEPYRNYVFDSLASKNVDNRIVQKREMMYTLLDNSDLIDRVVKETTIQEFQLNEVPIFQSGFSIKPEKIMRKKDIMLLNDSFRAIYFLKGQYEIDKILNCNISPNEKKYFTEISNETDGYYYSSNVDFTCIVAPYSDEELISSVGTDTIEDPLIYSLYNKVKTPILFVSMEKNNFIFCYLVENGKKEKRVGFILNTELELNGEFSKQERELISEGKSDFNKVEKFTNYHIFNFTKCESLFNEKFELMEFNKLTM